MPEITSNDISRFTEGDCHILARVLHDHSGGHYQMATLIENSHAFCVVDKDTALDINGFQPMEEFLKEWDSKGYLMVGWDFLRKYGHGKPRDARFGKYSWERAKKLAPILVGF